ncbi:MAG TPA: DUF6602 domain-containing protein [Planctomycetota bacterium]|nr:DUF6602 domain-containing protein [Planctomycetota bacterium]
MPPDQPFDLQAKFRAVSRALRASYEADSVGGSHHGEKGLRRDSVLGQFLARHLPPCYGVARGEVVAADGAISRQVDVVVYDALHAPLLQGSEASRVFPAESVYAAIEVKDHLDQAALARAVANIASVKRLDRSAIVEQHGGHRIVHGPKQNPPIFGAVFALDASDVAKTIVPLLAQHQRDMPIGSWVDCVCILDRALIYHFGYFVNRVGEAMWVPSLLDPDTRLGHYESQEDTLFLFYLYLLYQLNAKDLFPPDLIRYARGTPVPDPIIYRGAPPPP